MRKLSRSEAANRRRVRGETTNQKAPPANGGSAGSPGQNGHQDVRSPIAISAQTLVRPDAIAGTGTRGHASFDVSFGYNGAYTAGVHGLVDPFIQVGTGLPDDPDNTFDFGTGVGDILAYALPIPAGTAYAQWSTTSTPMASTTSTCTCSIARPIQTCLARLSTEETTSDRSASTSPFRSRPIRSGRVLVVPARVRNRGSTPAGLAVFDWTDPVPPARSRQHAPRSRHQDKRGGSARPIWTSVGKA